MPGTVKTKMGCRLLPGLALACVCAAGAARGADLDRPYYRPPPPPPPAALLSPPPSCEIVAEPQMNLYNEVTRTGIQRVCVSRGVYADHFWPYAPPYWRPNHRQGYGPEWSPGS